MIARLARSMPFLVHVMTGGGLPDTDTISRSEAPALMVTVFFKLLLQAPDLLLESKCQSLINLWTSVIRKIIHLKPWIRNTQSFHRLTSAVDSPFFHALHVHSSNSEGVFLAHFKVCHSEFVVSYCGFGMHSVPLISVLLLHFKNISYDVSATIIHGLGPG